MRCGVTHMPTLPRDMSTSTFRVIAWNCHGVVSGKAAFWEYFLDQNADLALLQEVNSIPDYVVSAYSVKAEKAVTKAGGKQRFSTCLLSKFPIAKAPTLTSDKQWVNNELEHFRGNLVSGRVEMQHSQINAISVYNPAWHIARERIFSYETTGVRLTQQGRDVWVCDILWSALRGVCQSDKLWIVGGDFNLSETFDAWAGGPHGNKEYLDRMTDLGLVECLRKHQGQLTPTFKNPRGGKIVHQIDHTWVSASLADCLVECRTPPTDEIFDVGLSDHLPIISDFDLSKLAS